MGNFCTPCMWLFAVHVSECVGPATYCIGCAAGPLPEQQLLVACGAAHRGKLAVLRSGLGLVPFMLDGPALPVSGAWLLPGKGHGEVNSTECDKAAGIAAAASSYMHLSR